MAHPLDNAVWGSLTGPHGALAQRAGSAVRYPADVAPFAAVPDEPTPGDWSDLGRLASGADAPVVLFRAPVDLGPGWVEAWGGVGVQLVWAGAGGSGPDDDLDDLDALGDHDIDEVLALIERTRPGPFARRTMAMGRYLGVRDPATGALVAMAGERLHPDGFCEVSAVCTDEGWRGRGLATRLVRAVVAGIVARGEVPFLHAASDNVTAIRLYLAMGFVHRRDIRFSSLRAPAT